MQQYEVLIGFHEAGSNRRHEAGERCDLSHVVDVADLIANGTVRLVANAEPDAEPQEAEG